MLHFHTRRIRLHACLFLYKLVVERHQILVGRLVIPHFQCLQQSMGLTHFRLELPQVFGGHRGSHPPDEAPKCYVNTLLWKITSHDHFQADVGIVTGMDKHIVPDGWSDLQFPLRDIPDQTGSIFQLFQFCHGIPHMDCPDMDISCSIYIPT